MWSSFALAGSARPPSCCMASRLPCCSGDVAGDPSESRESAGALQRPKAAEVERKGGKKGRKGREERKGGKEGRK